MDLVVTIGTPLLTLFVDVWVKRRLESWPILLSHWGHVASVNYTKEDGSIAR